LSLNTFLFVGRKHKDVKNVMVNHTVQWCINTSLKHNRKFHCICLFDIYYILKFNWSV